MAVVLSVAKDPRISLLSSLLPCLFLNQHKNHRVPHPSRALRWMGCIGSFRLLLPLLLLHPLFVIPQGSAFAVALVLYPPLKSHLDRSCSQSYREQRSGEILAFALAFAVACSCTHRESGNHSERTCINSVIL
jgi:hypothetical protein